MTKFRVPLIGELCLALLMTALGSVRRHHEGSHRPPRIPSPEETVASFRSFNGSVYLPPGNLVSELGVGWVREPLYWGEIEPRKGDWDWQPEDQTITRDEARGVQVLAMLAYTAPWDASVQRKDFSPPLKPEEWKVFVDRVVDRYSAPPFNLRYFQVWNEPTRQAGFWTGTDEQFVDLVYLPAAKVIRAHGCYVVFGGWPATNSLQEFDRVLEYHGAWRWTDFLDVHYQGLTALTYLYERWVKTGKCKGIWETEIGFTDDPGFIPNTYLPILYWSLANGWKGSDEFKLFWYAAWGAGLDSRKCLAQTDRNGRILLTAQGKRLALLNQLLGGGPLEDFSNYRADLGAAQGLVMGFKIRRLIVMAVLLKKSSLEQGQSVTLRLVPPPDVRVARAVTEDGFYLKPEVEDKRGTILIKFSPSSPRGGPGKSAVAYVIVGQRPR